MFKRKKKIMETTTNTYQKLIDAAKNVRVAAHAPYSDFFVGAAIVDENGEVHVGCNVENAAYPLGMCAEASAISSMVAAGGKRCMEVAIVASGPEAITPCGGCRQRLSEFMDASGVVYCCDEHGELQIKTTIGELLPYGFSARHLEE